MHPVGKLDHDDGALPRRSDESSCDGARTFAELAKDHVHRINLASSPPASTGGFLRIFVRLAACGKVHRHGSRYKPRELIRLATGEPTGIRDHVDYLRAKFVA